MNKARDAAWRAFGTRHWKTIVGFEVARKVLPWVAVPVAAGMVLGGGWWAVRRLHPTHRPAKPSSDAVVPTARPSAPAADIAQHVGDARLWLWAATATAALALAALVARQWWSPAVPTPRLRFALTGAVTVGLATAAIVWR